MSSQPKPERWELGVYGLLLAYFAARVVWLALSLHAYVPPDEITHIGRVLAYASVWGVPDNGRATFEYGLLDHRPWLYYWVMARTVALNVFPIPDLFFVRLMNGALGLATAVVGMLWVREWCRSPWARVLFGVLVTNTLMMTGLAGSVSYDNGANLLAAGSVLAFSRFRARRSAEWLLAFGALLLAGCLAKRTFLPLGFLLVVWLLVLRQGFRPKEAARLVSLPETHLATAQVIQPRVGAGLSHCLLHASVNYSTNRAIA